MYIYRYMEAYTDVEKYIQMDRSWIGVYTDV
jgi:hypothetical protein